MNILCLRYGQRQQVRALAKSKKDQRGVSAIEFAMIMPVFVMFLVGVTEMSLLVLAQHLLENATFNASRTAKTGYIATSKTQIETVMDVLLARLAGLSPLLEPAKVKVTWKSYGDLSKIGQPTEGVETMGTPAQVVVYTVSYPWQTFTPLIGKLIGDVDGVVNLTSRIVVRNEPYE